MNPDTAEKGHEPLKTLASYRRDGNKVLFGLNMIPESLGEISVGDAVEVS
ncbi:MAG: MOSC domain-containing protein [Bacteroidota bacterium]